MEVTRLDQLRKRSMKIKGPATHQPQSSASPVASPKDLSITHSKGIRGVKGESRDAQRVAKAFSLLVRVFCLFVFGLVEFCILVWGLGLVFVLALFFLEQGLAVNYINSNYLT